MGIQSRVRGMKVDLAIFDAVKMYNGYYSTQILEHLHQKIKIRKEVCILQVILNTI